MNEEKRTILEMVAEGKITEEQAAELLEALGDAGDSEDEAEPVPPKSSSTPPLTDEEYSQVYSEAYEKVYEPAYRAAYEKYGPESAELSAEIGNISDQAEAAAQKAVEDARAEKAAEAVITPSITVNDADGSATIYPDGTIEMQDGSGESMVLNGGGHGQKIQLQL